MSMFISSLESRRLLSALPITKATLTADKSEIAADVAAVKANLTIFTKTQTTETAGIAKDFKGLSKADLALLKTLETDETKSQALFIKQVSALDTPALATASKSFSAGISLLTKATVKELSTATADITALGSVTTVPLAALEAHLAETLVPSDRAAILAALPTQTALDAADTAQQTDSTTEKAAISAAASQLVTDIGTLATDLTAVHTAVGTFPTITDTFTGTATATAGKGKGETKDVTLVITSEDGNGNLSGTVTDFSGGIDPLVGTVSLNGVVTLKSSPGTGSVKISGTLNGNAITGKASFPKTSGTFSVVEVV